MVYRTPGIAARGGKTMCRSVADGGRRCPGCADPGTRVRANIRQRIGRYSRACANHYATGDDQRGEHYAQMLERDIAEYDRITAAEMPTVAVTQAAEYTPERTVNWTDDELAIAIGQPRRPGRAGTDSPDVAMARRSGC